MSFNILRLGLLPSRLSMAFIEYVNRIHCPLKLWLVPVQYKDTDYHSPYHNAR